MKTKLTLRLDGDLIAVAKKYSAATGKPLSRIVADLFASIQNQTGDQDTRPSPTVTSLRGILKGRNIDENAFKKHLEEKYL